MTGASARPPLAKGSGGLTTRRRQPGANPWIVRCFVPFPHCRHEFSLNYLQFVFSGTTLTVVSATTTALPGETQCSVQDLSWPGSYGHRGAKIAPFCGWTDWKPSARPRQRRRFRSSLPGKQPSPEAGRRSGRSTPGGPDRASVLQDARVLARLAPDRVRPGAFSGRIDHRDAHPRAAKQAIKRHFGPGHGVAVDALRARAPAHCDD